MRTVDLNVRSTSVQASNFHCNSITVCCSLEHAKEYANVIENNTVIMAIFNKPPISGVKFIYICSSS